MPGKIIKVTGGQRLRGSVRISGCKNSCLAIMAGSLLAKGPVTLRNVPDISDVHTMTEVIKSLGVYCDFKDNTLVIDATCIPNTHTDYKFVSKMRASFNVLGPVLARCGEATISRPGGCDLGERPIDYHIAGLKKLSANVIDLQSSLEVSHTGLKGTSIFLDRDSVGATEQIMSTACLASGTTRIINASIDPDVIELSRFLQALGANIRVSGKVIEIEGVRELRGTEYNIAFDRIEAGTFAVFGAITKGDIIIKDIIPDHLSSFLLKMKDAGVGIELIDNGDGTDLRVFLNGRPSPTDIFTSPFPGFPTDLMPGFLTLMSVAEGTSVITDTIFVDRFKFIDELKRLGVNVKRNSEQVCMVNGTDALTGADVKSTDLRGGTALIAAALASVGETRIHHIEHILRGYENLTGKLSGLGAETSMIEEA